MPNPTSSDLDDPDVKNEPLDYEEYPTNETWAFPEEEVTLKEEVMEDILTVTKEEKPATDWDSETFMEDHILQKASDTVFRPSQTQSKDHHPQEQKPDIAFYQTDERIISKTPMTQLEGLSHSELCKLLAVLSTEIVRLQAQLNNEMFTHEDNESPSDSDFIVIHNSSPVSLEVMDSCTQNILFKSGTLANSNEKTHKPDEHQPCDSLKTIINIPKSGTTCPKKASPLQDKTNVYAFACGHVCSVCNDKDTLARLEGSYTSVLPRVNLIPTTNKENAQLNGNIESMMSKIVITGCFLPQISKSTAQKENVKFGDETRSICKNQETANFKNSLCETSLGHDETSVIPSNGRNRETEKSLPSASSVLAKNASAKTTSGSIFSDLVNTSSQIPCFPMPITSKGNSMQHDNLKGMQNQEPECLLEMTAESITHDTDMDEIVNEKMNKIGTENISQMSESTESRPISGEDTRMTDENQQSYETSVILSNDKNIEIKKPTSSLLFNQKNSSSSKCPKSTLGQSKANNQYLMLNVSSTDSPNLKANSDKSPCATFSPGNIVQSDSEQQEQVIQVKRPKLNLHDLDQETLPVFTRTSTKEIIDRLISFCKITQH